RQGLVGSQGAAARSAGRRARVDRAGGTGPAGTAGTATAAAARGAVGRAVAGFDPQGLFLLGLGPGLLDLAPVRLEASARLGVLVLPLLALLLVAGQPLAGLGVEAPRTQLVALLVVGGRHAVQGRVEVF